jgi:hypothetical protein
MKDLRFNRHLVMAALLLAFASVANAGIVTVDFSGNGILAEIEATINNVTGALTATYITQSGDFFNGEYQFDLNLGDPSQGTVNEQSNQNAAFLDPVATLSNATSFTVTESPGGPDYDGSAVGWQAGDTVITCGDVFPTCNQFLTGIYSFGSNDFVSIVDASGTLESASASAPEPSYAWLMWAMGGLVLVWKRRTRLGV